MRSRMDAVQEPIIPVIGDLIRQVPGTISLGQGVVHYGPPEAALEAARAALNDPATHSYQSEAGLPAPLERVAAKLRRDNGIDVAAGSRIMITAGANMAFMHAILAITEPGDEIVLPVPFYFNHDMAIQMAGCRIVTVPTDDRYQLRLDAIHRAISDHTRAIVTVSPNNPSGAVFSEASLHEVNTLCRERGLYHLTDEVYEYFTYGSARHVSPGSFANAAAHTISMYSLSKAYGFAGWRIGFSHRERTVAPAVVVSPAPEPGTTTVQIGQFQGRWSPESGRLEWIDRGVYRSLAGSALDEATMIRIAESLQPPAEGSRR